MQKKHDYFFNKDASTKPSLDAFRKEHPELFKIRDKEIATALKNFSKNLKQVKLGVPYSTENLVMNIFGLRLEEGLQDLLDKYTEYEKTGDNYIFTHTADPESILK